MKAPGKGKVLFVDDTHGSAFLFMLAIRHLGYEVEFQNDADKVLQMFEKMADGQLALPDAIVLDIWFDNLPPNSPLNTKETEFGRYAGIYLARVLKSSPHTLNIPIIAITSFTTLGIVLPQDVHLERRYDISPVQFAERVDQTIRSSKSL
jgi:CheY-like chemotaxis protein